ncbi:FAD/NAD-P-binding domain-containing protein [Mycena alexandri]|uniref:electron-transferring-flavoprotein dehydrogenase n=1 Tax=Mycena alexandri TaxID=1745969 RepID=A0AAD6SZX2_9AGAR|nr:FAD/NAD-P-binding domain-containing protein [Mycena alexandri]
MLARRLLPRPRPRRLPLARHLSTRPDKPTPYSPLTEPRESEAVDVCIVGAGPAGLAAAIRLRQLSSETGKEVRVVVLEKGAEVGAHVLSGAVIEPSALDALLPGWREMEGQPLVQPVTSSGMRLLTQKWAIPIPHPPQMNNKGNYIASLSRVAAWLGSVAEDLGAEVYPGFAGAHLLLAPEPDFAWDSSSGGGGSSTGGLVRSIHGIITHDAGLTRARQKSPRFEAGVAFRARATLLAEGAHGSLSKQVVGMYGLREGKQGQTYGIGVKEVWRVGAEKHTPGKVLHTLGWPLDRHTYGGGWEYHMADGLVSIGLVVGLDYANPWIEPYREFQRMKHHPHFRALLSGPGAERLAYGARALTEGGLQSLPRLDFPGGALVGCAAGVVNTAKIKGTHNAMRTGMLAAEATFTALHPGVVFTSTAWDGTFEDVKPASASANAATADTADSDSDSHAPLSLAHYTAAFPRSPAHADLWAVRNVRPAFNTRFGVLGGVLYAGMDTLLGGRVPWTLAGHATKGLDPSTTSPDALATRPAASCQSIAYPPFEPPLSTDLMSSVALTGTNHAEGEAVHLRVMRGRGGALGADGSVQTSDSKAGPGTDTPVDADADAQRETAARRRAHVQTNVGTYAGLLQRACPAGVYEYVTDDGGRVVPGNDGEEEGWEGTKLVINSQNCIHCKLCDIKVPTQDITWTVPEGGGGPKYNAGDIGVWVCNLERVY